MTGSLVSHLGDLAETLRDLRRRLRQAARLEVARAVGDALREFTLDVISGGTRNAMPRHRETSNWDDPWRDPNHDPWDADDQFLDEDASEKESDNVGGTPLHAAIVLSLGAARWGYRRTGQMVVAVLIGAAVAIVILLRGPTAEAFLAAWAPAHELMFNSAHQP
jgi:hypothetical protein